ncbi:LEM_emerin domain-containing protein isoform X1 [Antennarius striatus]|uniref:LEM_emerin domain-containing protein isoform X1 n=1 Tax=Antennarius striatus TaxID=241820 RepID=UPI0035B484E3
MSSLSTISTQELYNLLEEYGIKHGPVVDSTRGLYEKKLKEAMAMGKRGKPTPDKTFYREEEEEVTYVYRTPVSSDKAGERGSYIRSRPEWTEGKFGHESSYSTPTHLYKRKDFSNEAGLNQFLKPIYRNPTEFSRSKQWRGKTSVSTPQFLEDRCLDQLELQRGREGGGGEERGRVAVYSLPQHLPSAFPRRVPVAGMVPSALSLRPGTSQKKSQKPYMYDTPTTYRNSYLTQSTHMKSGQEEPKAPKSSRLIPLWFQFVLFLVVAVILYMVFSNMETNESFQGIE